MSSLVMYRIFFVIALGLVGIFMLFGCQNKTVNIFGSKSPREQYTDKLRSAGLSDTKTGRLWNQTAASVLENAPKIEVPTQLLGSFKARTISARAWQFDLQKGASVEISVQWAPADSSKLFVDLIQWTGRADIRSSFAPGDDVHKFEAKQTGTYIVRLQPELLGEGNFVLNISGTATYSVFPVEGKDSRAIMSFWGVDRDGGARRHEGIDIFAIRGTPVLAPVSGWVTSVRNGGLGGKQVWIRDNDRGHSLYFAHLDSQVVRTAMRVNPGDTLGFVGNTGNARFTKPHLHFGIYSAGAFDPFPMVNNIHPEPAPVNLGFDESILNISTSTANMRSGPGISYSVVGTLSAANSVFVESVTSDWYQVRTPDGNRGYIFHNLLIPPLSKELSDTSVYVFNEPSHVAIDSLFINLGDFLQVGKYRDFDVLRDADANVYYSR